MTTREEKKTNLLCFHFVFESYRFVPMNFSRSVAHNLNFQLDSVAGKCISWKRRKNGHLHLWSEIVSNYFTVYLWIYVAVRMDGRAMPPLIFLVCVSGHFYRFAAYKNGNCDNSSSENCLPCAVCRACTRYVNGNANDAATHPNIFINGT